MKEIYIHGKDIPKKCFDCFCFDKEYAECTANSTGNISCEEGVFPEECPLKNLEEHDKEVARQARLELLQQILYPTMPNLSIEEVKLIGQYNLELRHRFNKSLLDYIFDEADAQDLGEFNGWGWIFSEEDVQRIKKVFLKTEE